MQAAQSEGATIPWGDIEIIDNDFDVRATDVAPDLRVTGQGVYFGRGPFGRVMIARNQIKLGTAEKGTGKNAIQVFAAAELEIADNNALTVEGGETLQKILAFNSTGKIVGNTAAAVVVDDPAKFLISENVTDAGGASDLRIYNRNEDAEAPEPAGEVETLRAENAALKTENKELLSALDASAARAVAAIAALEG